MKYLEERFTIATPIRVGAKEYCAVFGHKVIACGDGEFCATCGEDVDRGKGASVEGGGSYFDGERGGGGE